MRSEPWTQTPEERVQDLLDCTARLVAEIRRLKTEKAFAVLDAVLSDSVDDTGVPLTWREVAETAERERDEARAKLRETLERGIKISGRNALPVWLERSAGACFLWLVWAVKPGQVRLIAVCSDEQTADRFAANLPPGLVDFKAWKERAPIDHSFGFADSMHARIQGKLP